MSVMFMACALLSTSAFEQALVEVDADKGNVPLNALENGCTPEDLGAPCTTYSRTYSAPVTAEEHMSMLAYASVPPCTS